MRNDLASNQGPITDRQALRVNNTSELSSDRYRICAQKSLTMAPFFDNNITCLKLSFKGASDDDKTKAAQRFIDGQLAQMDDQIQQAERQRNLAVNQRRFGGTFSAVVLAVAFVLLALASVL